jgi:hypothetical protein
MAEHPTTPFGLRVCPRARRRGSSLGSGRNSGYGNREMVWDPARITPNSWANVLLFYRHLEERNDDFRPLGHLVEHVASRPYASSIVAATSGTALLVARNAQADWTHEAVRIDVDLSGAIRFALPEKRLVKATTFQCDGKKIVGTFESFLRKAAWVAV